MILDYFIEGLLGEARFDISPPSNYQFYGADNIDSESDDEGNALTRFIAPYIFVFQEKNMYDMDVKTILKYPVIKSDLGFVRYDEGGSFNLRPVFVTNDGDETDLTDTMVRSNPEVQAFFKSIADQMQVQVILDFSFDISEDDPSYDPSKSFDTLGDGSARDVFTKLNNVAFLLQDYIKNFNSFVVEDVVAKVFGNKYTAFTGLFQYYLTNIEFIGKQDTEGDMRRTNIYTKWFDTAGRKLGNMTALDVDGVELDAKYKDTRIA